MQEPSFSVVIPVFNSSNTLCELNSRLHQVLRSTGKSFEIIYVNDCSIDESWDHLTKIKTEFSDTTKLINLSENVGQHKSIFCGLSFAKGNFVIVMDDDMQVPPEEISKLIHCQEDQKADVVYGMFDHRKHSKIRNLGSRFTGYILRKFASTKKASSFKLISRPVVDRVVDTRFEYIFIDEIIGWFTANIAHVDVIHQDRQDGESSYSIWSLIAMTIKIILNYTVLPLRIMTYGGLISALLCLFIGSYYIYDKVFNAVQLGFTSIIVAIMFGTGVILFCLGIIGEYIRRLYFTQQYKPPFSIKEVIE